MTDTSEKPTPQYSIGDEVTVSRGKFRGRTGTIGMVGSTAYGVKFSDDTIDMIHFGNVKPKVEPTFTRAQIAAVLQDHGLEAVEADALLKDLDLSF